MSLKPEQVTRPVDPDPAVEGKQPKAVPSPTGSRKTARPIDVGSTPPGSKASEFMS